MRYRFLRFPGGKPKAVTLSYDDGCPADARFSDTVTPYGLKCTFNVTMRSKLSFAEMRTLFLERGHEIAVHGAQHRAPGVQSPIGGISDVLECRMRLEKEFGMIIRGMAYPDSGIRRFQNGASYQNIKHYLTDLDIAYARTLGGDNDSFMLPTDWHAWMPTAHHDNPGIMTYIDRILETDGNERYVAARYPRLFYIWGHSYEFDRNDNWGHLVNICERLSGREEIWYATNMEIYDYVTAYHSLVFSADEHMVYNPTRLKVWFNIDGRDYAVCGGETLYI